MSTSLEPSPQPSLDVHEAMTASALRTLHPRLHDWYDESTLAQNLCAHLAEAAGWVDDEYFGAACRDGVAVIDVPEARDWANRWFDLPHGGWAVTGIRFRNRDLAKPFVEVVAHDAGRASPEEHWRVLVNEIGRAYAPFAPGKLQVFTSSPGAACDAFVAGARAEVDTYLVAGPIRELRNRPRSPRFDDVTLAPVSAAGASELAVRVHEELAEQNPDTLAWSIPQASEDFDDYAEAGTLFGIHVDDTLVGAVAASRWNAHGMTGFAVVENVIAAPHRGRKLAPATMQHLLERLPVDDDDALWGTIHPDNTPSLRNALGIGREIVGGHVWVTPLGWPGW